MKSIKILLAGSIMLATLVACNDDFMDRFPTTDISDQNFWYSARDMELYCNGLYTYIKGHGTGHDRSPMLSGDNQSDNMAPQDYDKVAAGEHIVPESSNGNEWSWTFIRKCNYFLARYQQAEISQEEKDAYAAEVYFFKAWDYFEKVKRYGDVPWLTKDLTTESEELFGSRDSRVEVMDSVLACIDWAIEKLPAKKNAVSGRINKDVALILKARICLHEGTFRKYHQIDNSEKFLKEAVNTSQTLMKEGHYQIYNTNNPESDYRTLFCSLDLKDNPEMIYYKVYEEGLLGNRTSNLLEGGESTLGFSVSKSLIDAYLCECGKPISLCKEHFLGHDSIQAEMLHRDPRLCQTICYPGKDLQRDTKKPAIPGSNISTSNIPTGYQIIKYWVDDPAEYLRYQNGILDAPVFRYAEALLVYAEAKAELGECTQSDLDLSVNLLRKRAGMPDMKIDQLVKDPMSDFPSLPVLIDEIRRERRVEFALENMRYDDLMRWKAGKLMEKTVRGMKFVQSQYPTVVIGKHIDVDKEGFILPYWNILPNGRKFDESKHYYFPLPTEELVINKNLKQNPGW
nr:RagB/SusD family nutrient uptake outer membrane protein [Parabacteroides goldsteinii]